MKHPTSRNRVQRQAELYNKKYIGSGRNIDVGAEDATTCPSANKQEDDKSCSSYESDENEHNFRLRANQFRINQHKQLINLVASFQRQQQRFRTEYQQHVYVVDREKILSKLSSLTPFFYFTSSQFTSMINLLCFLLTDSLKDSDFHSGKQTLRLGELFGMYLAPHILILCRGGVQERLAALCDAEVAKHLGAPSKAGLGSALSSANPIAFWTQLAVDLVSEDLLTWAAITEQMATQPLLQEEDDPLGETVRALSDRVRSLFAAMKSAEVRLLLVLLRVQELSKVMQTYGLSLETVRTLRTLIAGQVGLRTLCTSEKDGLLPRLVPSKGFLLALLDVAAALGLQSASIARSRRRFSTRRVSRSFAAPSNSSSRSRSSGSPPETAAPISQCRSIEDSSRFQSLFLPYEVPVGGGLRFLNGQQIDSKCLSHEVGFSAVIQLIFAVHLKWLQFLNDCKENKQKQNFSQSRRKSEIDTVVSTLCICGLPIGNWTFVGADSGPSGNIEELASKLRAIRGDRVDSLERQCIDEGETAIRANIPKSLCERCYRAVLLCSQPQSLPALAVTNVYSTGCCPLLRVRALTRPSFEQVFHISDRFSEFVDHKQIESEMMLRLGSVSPLSEPFRNPILDFPSVDTQLSILMQQAAKRGIEPGNCFARSTFPPAGPTPLDPKKYSSRELRCVRSHSSLIFHFPCQQLLSRRNSEADLVQPEVQFTDVSPSVPSDPSALHLEDETVAMYRHILANSQGSKNNRSSMTRRSLQQKGSVTFSLPTEIVTEGLRAYSPLVQGARINEDFSLEGSVNPFSPEIKDDAFNSVTMELALTEVDSKEDMSALAPTIAGYPFEQTSPRRERSFKLGGIVSHHKIRDFSRRIMNVVTTASGLGYGNVLDKEKGGTQVASSSSKKSSNASGSIISSGGNYYSGYGLRARTRVPVVINPNNLKVPQTSYHAKGFFDLQQFVLDLWAGIPVKLVYAGIPPQEKARLLYIRSSIGIENERINEQLLMHRRQAAKSANGNEPNIGNSKKKTASSFSSLTKRVSFTAKEDCTNDTQSSTSSVRTVPYLSQDLDFLANPMSPSKSNVISEVIKRDSTSRLFLCWAKAPSAGGKDTKEKGHESVKLGFDPDKSLDLDLLCDIQQGCGAWAQCMHLVFSTLPSPQPSLPQTLVAKVDDLQLLHKLLMGIGEIAKSREKR